MAGLAGIVGREHVLAPPAGSAWARDAGEAADGSGRLDAVVLPADAEQVAAVVAWCYERGLAITPRGGGSGLAGGAVPCGGVVLALERLRRVRRFEPERWRACVEAGVGTASLQRRARAAGMYFPPDPGAADRSQIGGNIATNAGGPHAFKYGVTGVWVTGLEVVLPPGELVSFGGPIRKDAAGYDLRSLLVGSEGTLGVITAAWLRLIPAPAAALPVLARYPSVAAGCAAVEAVLAARIEAAALEFLDGRAAELAGGGGGCAFVVIAEADGSVAEASRVRAELIEVLGAEALGLDAPTEPAAIADLWRWRSGVGPTVRARRGAKISEDIVVPVERLGEAVEETLAIGGRHGLEACSWGHAGDGNLHATLLVAPGEVGGTAAAAAVEEIFGLAARLGGSISGEHGIGLAKNGQLRLVWAPAALGLHARVKAACDPRGLMNPGKKLAG